MLDFLQGTVGERLSVDSYREDYEKRFAASGSHESWKLERKQQFRQPKHASWEAFARGDWDEALRLIENRRQHLYELSKEDAARGITLFRVRVVEEPIIPYLQWELHSLRLRAECGEKIRVVGPEQAVKFEDVGQLPELLTVGRDTVYEILYDKSGVLDGAIRFVNPDATARCNNFIGQLYSNGEELSSYFDRRVAHLEPPQVV